MPRVGDVFQLLSGTLAVPNTTIASSPYNAQQNDWVTEANSPRPVSAGGTGGTTAETARTELGAIGAADLAGADTKAVPVGTDSLVIIDSEDANATKRWLVSDIPAYLNTLTSSNATMRNRLVNAGMQVKQENSGSVTTNGSYPADQWQLNFVTSGTPSAVSTSDSDLSGNYIQISSGSADTSIAATDNVHLIQKLEGYRISDFQWHNTSIPPAHSVVLRFDACCSPNPLVIGVAVRNAAGTRSWVKNVSLAGDFVWQTFSIQIPGDEELGWFGDESPALGVAFTLMAGSNFIAATPETWLNTNSLAASGISNFMAATNAVRIRRAGLYLDPVGAGLAPVWEQPDYATELRACQRYYQTMGPLAMNGYHGSASGIISSTISLPTVMRATPVITVTTAGTVGNATAINDTPTVSSFRFGTTATAAGSTNILGRVLAFNARL